MPLGVHDVMVLADMASCSEGDFFGLGASSGIPIEYTASLVTI